jgi:hypothetical protein
VTAKVKSSRSGENATAKTSKALGKFLGLVGYVDVDRFNRATRQARLCSNIAIALNKDASRIYVLDFKNNFIRVMERANTEPNR